MERRLVRGGLVRAAAMSTLVAMVATGCESPSEPDFDAAAPGAGVEDAAAARAADAAAVLAADAADGRATAPAGWVTVSGLDSGPFEVRVQVPQDYLDAEAAFFDGFGLEAASTDGSAPGAHVGWRAAQTDVRFPVALRLDVRWPDELALDAASVEVVGWHAELGEWVREPIVEAGAGANRLVVETTQTTTWRLVARDAAVAALPLARDLDGWAVAPDIDALIDLVAASDSDDAALAAGDKAIRSVLFRVKGKTTDTVCIEVEGQAPFALAQNSPGNFSATVPLDVPATIRWRVLLSSTPTCDTVVSTVYPDALWRAAIGDIYTTNTSCATSGGVAWQQTAMTTKRAGTNTGTDVCPPTTSLVNLLTVEFRVTDHEDRVAPGTTLCLDIQDRGIVAMYDKPGRYTRSRGVPSPATSTFRIFEAAGADCSTEARRLTFDDATFWVAGTPMTDPLCTRAATDDAWERSFRVAVAAGPTATPAGTEACPSCGPGTALDASSACVGCAPGSVSPGGPPCTACSAGREPDAALASCDLCEAGTHSPDGTACIPCPAGLVAPLVGMAACEACETGVPLSSGDGCESCPAGTYAGTEGGCTPCDPGRYAAEAGATSCDVCATGTFSAVSGAVACTPCEPGRAAATTGATQCDPCDAGQFADTAGAATCNACLPGSSSAPGSASCTPCAAGTFNQLAGSTCAECAVGSFSVEGATACSPCAAGTFAGDAGSGACTQCTAGTFAAEPGASSCDACPMGTFSAAGATSCSPCAEGSFAPLDGSVSCAACEAGTFAAAPGSASCNLCPMGTLSGAGAAACSPCSPGSFASTTGNDACSPCNAGTFAALSGSITCSPCAAGQFTDGEGSASCTSCPAGFTSIPGSASCAPCSAGTFASMDGSATCSDCLPGFWSATGASVCSACEAGTFAAASGSASCETCPAGTAAASGSIECTACPPGTSSDAGSASCVTCEAGTFAALGGSASCAPCTAGTISTNGASECTSCPAGQTSTDGLVCVCDPFQHLDDELDCGCEGACGGGEVCEDGACVAQGPFCGDGDVDTTLMPTSLTLSWEGVGCGGNFPVYLSINGTDVGPFLDDSGCFADGSLRRAVIDDPATLALINPGVSNNFRFRDPASSNDGIYWAKLRFNGSAQTIVFREPSPGAAAAEPGVPCCSIPASIDTTVAFSPTLATVESCDDGDNLGNDGCGPDCRAEAFGACGDGVQNGQMLSATSLTFMWNLRNCEVPEPQTDVYLMVNGAIVASTIDETACFCGQGASSLTIDDPEVLALFVPGAVNTFGFFTDDADNAVTAWAKVIVDGVDQTVIYEFNAGDATAEVTHSCTDAYVEVDRVAVANNAHLFGAETCDDGNTTNGDGCDNNCTPTGCGNGLVTSGEACDDGGDSATCNGDCTVSVCGDDYTNTVDGETCDDGNTTPLDGCSATCQREFCGDNLVSTGEACDDGGTLNGDGCSATCRIEECGDGTVQVGEACDDGNTAPGDGCSPTCTFECGDGVGSQGAVASAVISYLAVACSTGQRFTVTIDGQPVDSFSVPNSCVCSPGVRTYAITSPSVLALLSGGQRDIGLLSNNAGGGPGATWATISINGGAAIALFDPYDAIGATDACAVGYTNIHGGETTLYREACDDGGNANGDGCSATCLIEACGNGILDPGEACDDGNTVNTDNCSNACVLNALCGNSTVNSGEACDTAGNSASCDIDCTAVRCGDGRINPAAGETCDDGNLRGGDGCSATCRTEACGNSVVDVGEACDGGAGCTGSCEASSCTLGTDTDDDGLDNCHETNTGVFVSIVDTGTDPTRVDSDGDALPDGDEVLGTAAGLALPSLGANPNRRDIFLEVDWLESPTCGTLQPPLNTLDTIVRMFARAPISNRDGSRGVTLHIDAGQGWPLDGGNEIPGRNGAYTDGGLGGEFYADKAVHFAPERFGYFHYTVVAESFSETAAGLGEVPGDDTVNANGCDTGNTLGVIMAHELGHNLGLSHGGNTPCNYKPNYVSIMNYRFSYNIDVDCDGIGDGRFHTYSTGPNASLNENSLLEANGVCGGIARDWNGNGSINASAVAVNINNQESQQAANCGGNRTVLTDYNDWANLDFLGPVPQGAAERPSEIVICDGL